MKRRRPINPDSGTTERNGDMSDYPQGFYLLATPHEMTETLYCGDCLRERGIPQDATVPDTGEADTPRHCDRCRVLTDGSLTSVGYVADALAEASGDPDVLDAWADRWGTLVLDRWGDEARRLGADAGRAAGSWAADGNSDPAACAATLRGLADGDPGAYDRLPPCPDLSGQWADADSPADVLEYVTGYREAASIGRVPADEVAAGICDAWESGAREAWEASCGETLRMFAA